MTPEEQRLRYLRLKAKAAAATQPAQEQVEPSLGEEAAATLSGAGDMLTLGYAPQIQAGLAKGVAAVTPFEAQDVLAALQAPIGDVLDPKTYDGLPEGEQSFIQLRDAARAREEAVQKKDELSAGLGKVLGAVAMPGAAGLLRSAAMGAGMGALYNPGDTRGEASDLQLQERLLGGLVGGAGGGLGAAIPKVPGYLKEKAQSLAARAVGRGTKGMKKALGEKGFLAMGQEAMDQGIVGWIPKTQQGIVDASKSALKSTGQQIGKAIEEAPAAPSISKQSVSARVIDDIAPADALPSPEILQKIERQAASLQGRGAGDTLTPQQAFKIKTDIAQNMEKSNAWRRLKSGTGTEDDVVRAAFVRSLDNAVQEGAAVPQALKQSYENLKNIQKIAEDTAAAGNTNNLVSAYDLIAGGLLGGGTYASTGDPLAAGAAALALKGGRAFGPQIAAKVLQAGSKAASPLAGAVVSPAVGVNFYEMLRSK